jgi:predicted tellurium resistance membrane protein TerC
MLELLFAVLEAVLEIFFEAAFEFAAEFFGALILRVVAAVFDTSEFKNPWLACVGYVFLGGVAGGLSLLVFPHRLVHPSRVPGLSVIISPVLAGLGMSLVGSTLRKRNKKAMQIESFGYGFAFAFGMALVRFFFAKGT